jgi:hypothetical protein
MTSPKLIPNYLIETTIPKPLPYKSLGKIMQIIGHIPLLKVAKILLIKYSKEL